MATLLDYPSVLVRVSCDRCGRRGAYRLVRLAAQFGANAPLEQLLRHLTRDCVRTMEPPRGYRRGENVCFARFEDLSPPPAFKPYVAPPLRRFREPPPKRVPTIAEIRRDTPWVWAYCAGHKCHHQEPIALVPLMIRWGPNASSDMIRRNLRCSKCGHRGVTIQSPSWGMAEGGFRHWPKR